MPSVANIVGTDLSKYKIVKPGQFSCNRMHVGRDYRLPISLSKEDAPFLVSPAYDVFEISKPDELFGEYLMMWFSRAEFDRNSWFYTDTDVRGKLGWDSFCDMTLPIPPIEEQRAIVAEYKTVTDRISLNEQINTKLEEAAQALYRHWFVDFEFPDENGKPYKSSGGKMVYNEELEKEVPVEFSFLQLDMVSDLITDGAHASPPSVDIGIPMASVKDMEAWKLNLQSARHISVEDFEKLANSNCKPLENDILIAKDGSYLKHIFVTRREEDVVILSSIALLRPNGQYLSDLLSMYLKMDSTKRRLTNSVNGGAIQRIILKEFRSFKVEVPPLKVQLNLIIKVKPLLNRCWENSLLNDHLYNISSKLLSKMAGSKAFTKPKALAV